MPTYPTHLRSGTGAALFERRPNLYSRRHGSPGDASGAVDVIGDEAKSVFAIYEGAPRAGKDADEAGPVYSAGAGGPLAVPTGRVFVRLAEQARAEDRRAQFEAAGFDIERSPSYAPIRRGSCRETAAWRIRCRRWPIWNAYPVSCMSSLRC